MRSFLSLLLLCAFSLLHAQDVDVDKSSGLVQVDGRDAFYLKVTNKSFGSKDFVLTNLDGEELAYLKYDSRPNNTWNSTTRQYNSDVFYGITFSKSGNYCEIILRSFSMAKFLAKQIASARLIHNGQISADDEQKFVVMHNGTFLKNPNAGPAVIVNNVPPARSGNDAPKRTADISISGDKIYNNDELLGTFKSEQAQGIQNLTIYNPSDVATIRAMRRSDGDGDWEITVQGRKTTIRYHADAPLQKLFTRLVENGYFD